MKKIINLSQAQEICKQLKKAGKTLVLVGGCFDIFHYGHFYYLKKAKSYGDILIVALENDQRVRMLKGINRPVTGEKERAELISAFNFIDFVIILPNMFNNQSYSDLVSEIKPDIIAVTSGDTQLANKKKQAESVGGKVIVIPRLNTPSTSELLEIIKKSI